MGADSDLADSDTNSIDSTLSADNIGVGEKDRMLMDKCLRLLMQNQIPLLTPPSVKVICVMFYYYY